MSELGRYEVTGFTSPALDALLDAIRATHTNGGVLFTQVRAVDVDDPDRWFAVGRSIYWDNEVFRSLFDSPGVRTALRKLKIPAPYPIAKPPQFCQPPTGTFTLAGELAAVLAQGGAYTRFPGSPAEAMRLAAAGVADIVGDRHDRFRVFQSGRAWTPWFCDVAWNLTWIVADYERLLVSILCKPTPTSPVTDAGIRTQKVNLRCAGSGRMEPCLTEPAKMRQDGCPMPSRFGVWARPQRPT